MQLNYRSSTSRKEILKIISDNSNNKKSILWQAFPDHRTIYEVIDINTDYPKGVIKVEIDQSSEPVNESLPVYLKLSYRETIFKGSVLSFEGNSVVISIPDEIKTTELREYPRCNFTPDQERHAIIGVVTNFVRNATQALKIKIFDISINGLGVVVSEANKRFFYKGAYVYLELLDELKVEPKRLGEVIYCEPFYYRQDGKQEKAYRIGIKLIQPLTQNFLSFYISGIEEEVKSGVDNFNRIMFDDELSKQIEKVIDTTLTKLRKNLSFKKVLASLEVDRDPEKYYAQHVLALAKVVCSLAKLLNWVSDVTLEKLVYVCYIHDVAFIENTHLAKIKDMIELRANDSVLSDEEKNIYVRSPEIALEFWRNDKYGPEDADKILIQQKERPDRSGYPKGLPSSKIAPLSALFIVAHDFIDYVYSDEDWTLPLYLEDAKAKFKGGYFNKIIESLEIIQFKV